MKWKACCCHPDFTNHSTLRNCKQKYVTEIPDIVGRNTLNSAQIVIVGINRAFKPRSLKLIASICFGAIHAARSELETPLIHTTSPETWEP